MEETDKPVEFVGSALDDLRAFPPFRLSAFPPFRLSAFPPSARRNAGYQLERIQAGLEPNDWKPMTAVGVGVREIRIRESDGTFRVIYVAKFSDAIYVLHCFQKKTQATSKLDLRLAATRYKQVKEQHQ